jgi:(1->4)-alpha-D-glucan 1-alpha-D-glucosylmutase
MNTPGSTYRIQFTPSFGFQQMTGVIPYLADLGVSHVYASPIFKARKGSTHGYDVVDPNQLNPDLGTEHDFARMMERLRVQGMGWVQDVVPNHMAYDHENPVLADVLENGLRSPFYSFFDIDWEHSYENIRGRVMAPFLGRFFGEILEDGEITMSYGPEGLTIHYFDLTFPLAIDSYLLVLSHGLAALKRTVGDDHPDYVTLLGVLYVLKSLGSGEQDVDTYDQVRFVKRMLWDMYSRSVLFKGFLDASICFFNGSKGAPESFNALDDLLSKQIFRLSYWKIATKEINYRRFFNINGLISLRVQDDAVFRHTHGLIGRLIQDGMVAGLRIDHVDGLYDPKGYLSHLREIFPAGYVVVEKILDPDENLPQTWPVQGTTGYDFMNYCNGLFCDSRNRKAFNRIYSGFVGMKSDIQELVREKKRGIIFEDMAGDVNNLAQELKTISSRDRHGSDITLYGLRRALTEILIEFPVYRTYVDEQGITLDDRKHIQVALEKAVTHSPAVSPELGFIKRFLLLEFPPYVDDDQKRDWVRFVMRFQQHTGPLMAKGVEDTVMYVYNRLISLNEVGANPDRFGCAPAEFHRFLQARNELWPHSLNATATHDTKRGEDLRARINVLSEIPNEWERCVRRWSALNRSKKKRVGAILLPDKNDEYFLYQTLIGAWPFDESAQLQFVDRIKAYAVKAVREAKIHTAWIRPDTAYEDAYGSFVDSILRPGESNAFLREFKPFARKVAHFGVLNSLSQTLIKITAGGVPDVYQGTELWDLNLVDPDNRRPVDFAVRQAFLSEMKERSVKDLPELIRELLTTREDGRVKLFLIWKALGIRRFWQEVFLKGNYMPLETVGPRKDHVIAFARQSETVCTMTIVPRLCTALVEEDRFPLGTEIWQDTQIIVPAGLPDDWRDAFTDGPVSSADGYVSVGEALRSFPVALLVSRLLS